MIINNSIVEIVNKNLNEHWSSNIEVEASIKSIISRSQFRRSLEYLLSICDSHHDAEEVLDISYNNKRFSVKGKDKIAEFCKSNNQSNISSSIKKDRLAKIAIDEYGCDIRISKEMVIDEPYNISADKFFRLKKRFSTTFVDGYRVDYTIVKSGNGKKVADAVFGPETYEIEIEYIGKNKPLITDLLDYTEEVMKSIRDEVFLSRLSEKGAVIAGYFAVVKDSMGLKGPLDNFKSSPRRMFIGPQPITLGVSDVSSIFTDYMVTDKADGQRFIGYVDEKGILFLINAKMDVKNTNVVCGDMWKKAIFDCECTKLIDGSMMILLFDCYFGKNGTHVFEKTLPERLTVIESFVGDVEGGGYALKAKTFHNDVKSGAKLILNNKDMLYKTDGLIYTPKLLPAKLGGTWNLVFKWKPPADNSIDFLTLYQRYDTGHDIITDGKKILNLYVGAVTAGAKQYFENTINGYCAKLFTPPNSIEYNTWYVSLDFDQTSGLIKCENGDEIVHKSVVEMRYDLQEKRWIPMRLRVDKTEESQGGKIITANSVQNAESVWKTIISPIPEDVIKGKKHMVTIDNIDVDIESDKYYARDIDRNKSLTLPMMTFHNFWVKNKSLISNFKKANSLLDLACGKGGDLSKWIAGRYSTVVGIDIFEDNINNVVDGAYTRLKDSKNRLPEGAKYAFLPMDSSQPIKEQIGEIKDEYMKQLAKCIWGIDRNPHESIKHLAGIAVDKFDVVSIQFALHYFFENDKKLNGFLENVNDHLKGGGFFIGTCFDGKAVSDLLSNVEEGGIKSGSKLGKEIWSIKKKYKEYKPAEIGQQIEVYVETINQYHQEYLVNYEVLKERLAKYDIHPITRKECQELDIGFDESMGRFDTLFNRMLEINKDIISKADNPKYKDNPIVKSYKMTECEDERTFSFLNMWFIFRKGAAPTKKAAIKEKEKKPRKAKN